MVEAFDNEIDLNGDMRNTKQIRNKQAKVRYNVQETIKRNEKAEKRSLQSKAAKGQLPTIGKLEQKQFQQIQQYYSNTSRGNKTTKHKEENKIDFNIGEENSLSKTKRQQSKSMIDLLDTKYA